MQASRNDRIKNVFSATEAFSLPGDHGGRHSVLVHESIWQTLCPAVDMHRPPARRLQIPHTSILQNKVVFL